MRKIIVLSLSCLALSCSTTNVAQQKDYAKADVAKYMNTITEGDLKKHLTIVASAEMEGRETATPGQRRAAAYIAEQFRKMGLTPAPGTNNYQQEYPLFYDTIIKADLTVGGKSLVLGKDFNVSAQSNNTKKYESNQVVFVGYGTTICIVHKQVNIFPVSITAIGRIVTKTGIV